jgi:hypothetical protein
MSRCHREPTLTEALADPLIRTLMQADGVDPEQLEASLKATARQIRGRNSKRGLLPGCC